MRRPTQEMLNAYVDGEMTSSDAAAVASALAADPGIAGQVAKLSQLKAAVQRDHDLRFAEEPPFCPSSPPTRWPRRGIVAAALALVALIAGTVTLQDLGMTDARWHREARSLHDAWAADSGPIGTRSGETRPGETGAVDGSHPVEILDPRPASLDPAAVLPDLSDARLSLAWARQIERQGAEPLIHAAYAGTRGCKVSFFVTVLEASSDQPPSSLGRDRAMAWQVDRVGYLLMATGMDPKRFEVITESLYRATVTRARFGPETREALARSRAESAPCPA